MNKESAVKNISDMLISRKVAPWKAEQVYCTSPTKEKAYYFFPVNFYMLLHVF